MRSEKNYRRIVVKVGSSLLYSKGGRLDFSIFRNIGHQIINLVKDQKEIVIVSSGAIALGMHMLGLKERPKKMSDLQAIAAIGQNELINVYRKIFSSTGCFGAQILLTHEDFDDRRRYLNARNTLLSLLGYRKYRLQRPIPIVNENDTISTEEIKFGDNDKLSALVASLISADLLVILSDVDGLLDRDRKVIPVIESINSEIKALASPTQKESSVGGMITKIEAAKIAMDSGISCIIANGRRKNILLSLMETPEKAGTIFIPKKCLTSREHWIAFGTKPKGKIIVDDGAKDALVNRNKSLLAVGIIKVCGSFSARDIISIADKEGREFARGIVSLSSLQVVEMVGKKFAREVVHRDNMVVL